MNEGMPVYREPFDKGRLIIIFRVSFPPDNFLPPAKIAQLEKLLPPREEVMISDNAEEAVMQPFDPEAERERSHQRREAYDSGDEGSPHGQRVQCATH
jgi:DnaJ family protein A protein 1